MSIQTSPRIFHCTEAGASKFWTIITEPDGKSLTVVFGKIGTAGQSKTKLFATVDQCAKEVAKLIREKTGKGYVEQGAGTSGEVTQTKTPAPGKPSVTITGLKTKFTKADYKAAAKVLHSLDRAAIDAMIDTGIPLDEPKFAPTASFPESTAIGSLIQCASTYYVGNPDKAGHTGKVDDTILYLISRGAKVDASDAWFILHNYLFKTFDYLLENGLIDINVPCRDEKNLLAACQYDIGAIMHLVEKGGDPRTAPEILHAAAIFGPHEFLRRLIEEYKLPLDTLNRNSQTVTEAADDYYQKITLNNLPIVESCAHNPHLAGIRDNQGHTPAENLARYREQEKNRDYLVALARTAAPKEPAKPDPKLDRILLDSCKQKDLDQTNAIARLLKSGANPNARDEDGRTPLHHLAAQHYPHIIEQGVRALRDAGADVNALDNEGRTALFYFFTGYAGDAGAARMLVTAGINPAHKDKHGRTALAHMLATAPVEEDHEARSTVSTFLHVGVPAVDCDSLGNTALHLAVSQQDLGGDAEEIIELAIAKGADVNARNKAGYTPLHLAVMRPEPDRHTFHDYLVKELLRNKADINAQDPEGNTAIHLCADPDEDISDLVSGNPDLSIANKVGTTVLQHIKNLGYYDENEHARLKRDIDALLAEPASERKLPSLAWPSAPIDPGANSPAKLEIVSSFHIQKNDADDDMVYIGGNRLAIAGNIPTNVTVFDTLKGEVIWHLNRCEDGAHNIAHDDGAVYVAREYCGRRYLTAHHPDTGEQIWECGMSSSYKQFGTRLLCTPNYVVHASQSASKFYPVSKKTGKKYIAPLINPFPQRKAGNNHDWGAQHGDPYWRSDALIPYGDTILVLGVKPRQHIVALDQYDLTAKGAHMRTVAELPEETLPIGHILHGDNLYLFTTDGHLRKIHVPDGKILLDHDHCPDVEHTFTELSYDCSGNQFTYLLKSNCGHYCVHNTYDLVAGKIVSSHTLKEEPPLSIHRPTIKDLAKIYCFGEHGPTGRELIIYDTAKQEKIAELTLPNYGGYDWAEQRLLLGDAIYVLQKGGLENDEDTCVLHKIQ